MNKMLSFAKLKGIYAGVFLYIKNLCIACFNLKFENHAFAAPLFYFRVLMYRSNS